MSSTPLPEFEVDNIKIEEPEQTEGQTGHKFIYTLRQCPMGKFRSGSNFRKPWLESDLSRSKLFRSSKRQMTALVGDLIWRSN